MTLAINTNQLLSSHVRIGRERYVGRHIACPQPRRLTADQWHARDEYQPRHADKYEGDR